MREIKLTIKNKLGLHARASAKFVSTALRFQSNLVIFKQHQSPGINGKSIMAVMTLGATQGTEIVLKIEGVDELDMEAALVGLINNNFGEAE